MTAARRLAHLGISVVVLAAIVAVPWALVRWVGWPLPTVIPGGTQIGLGLRSADIPDTLIVKTLACVVWIAWADLILAFAWELFVNHPHLARGHAPQPPVVVNRWAAGLATYVIAGLLSLASVAGPANATPLSGTPSAPKLAPEPAPPLLAPLNLRDTPPAPAHASAQPAAGDPTWTTQRGDTLWNIAEVTTGDPNRFGEILALNADQLTRPRDLRPGMILRLPADAHVPDERTTPPTASRPVTIHVVQPGESEWSIAQEQRPGQPAAVVAPVWAEIVTANGSAVADPDVVYPGQTLIIPENAAPPASPAVASPPAAAAAPVPPPPARAAAQPPTEVVPPAPPDSNVPLRADPAPPQLAPAPAAPTTTAAPAIPAPPVPAAVPAPKEPSPATILSGRAARAQTANDPRWALGAGGILLGAGLSAEVLRRRSRAMARRRPTQRLAPIPPHLDPVAHDVLSAPVDDARWLAAELRLVCAAVGDTDRDRFGVTVVQYEAPHTIEIALVSPIPDPPDGWEAQAGGLIWSLTEAHSHDELGAALDLPPALPALVTVGDPEGEGRTLLNLEHAGLIGISGYPDMVAAFVRSVVWELATTPLAERDQLIGLGVEIPGLASVAHWRIVNDEQTLLAELAVATDLTAALLTDGETPVAVRCRGRESVPPTIAVVSADRASAEVLSARAPGVIVIVVGAEPDGALEVRVTDGQLAVPALGLVCPARQLSAELSTAMGELLDAADAPLITPPPADDPAATSPIEVLELGLTMDDPADAADSADPWAWLPPEPRVWLSVLGPVSARGADLTQQQIAALTYLALHPDPAPTTAQIKDAVWGGLEPTPKRWRDFLYELRRAVGPAAIVAVGDDAFTLGPDVGTDITVVQALLDRADQHPQQRWVLLERAIRHLRGVPFTVPSNAARYWRWIDAEYLDARLYARLADAAVSLGRHHLDQGDPDKAKAITELGLKALPIDSALTELLMDAYAALGSPGAAERVFDAHQRALDDLGLSSASDETQAVIEAIRRAQGQRAAGGRSDYAIKGV